MAGRSLSFTVLAIMSLFLCGSCSREKPVEPTVTTPSVVPSATAIPPSDPKVTAAVGKMQDAERAWLAQSPEAAAAFQRLTSAQSAYRGTIEKFALYTVPARERAACARALQAASVKGDAAALAKAGQELADAQKRVEEGEAKLRLGNPLIQKTYDEWMAARKAYADLRAADETISKASADVLKLTENDNGLDRVRNADEHAKEN